MPSMGRAILVVLVVVVACSPAADEKTPSDPQADWASAMLAMEPTAREVREADALLAQLTKMRWVRFGTPEWVAAREMTTWACDSGALVCHNGSAPPALPQPSGCALILPPPGSCWGTTYTRICRPGAVHPRDSWWMPLRAS
jgi:hypothetical protein